MSLVDIVRYGSSAKGRYDNCPQTVQQAKLASELSKKAMQKGSLSPARLPSPEFGSGVDGGLR